MPVWSSHLAGGEKWESIMRGHQKGHWIFIGLSSKKPAFFGPWPSLGGCFHAATAATTTSHQIFATVSLSLFPLLESVFQDALWNHNLKDDDLSIGSSCGVPGASLIFVSSDWLSLPIGKVWVGFARQSALTVLICAHHRDFWPCLTCFLNFCAQVMAFTSLGVVIISTLTFVLGTFPEFQPESESGVPEEYPEAVYVMGIIDNLAVGFFLIEYVVSTNVEVRLRDRMCMVMKGKCDWKWFLCSDTCVSKAGFCTKLMCRHRKESKTHHTTSTFDDSQDCGLKSSFLKYSTLLTETQGSGGHALSPAQPE